MRLKVRLKGGGSGELSPAEDAGVVVAGRRCGPTGAVMHAQVGSHVAAAVERPKTDGARERLDAGVDKPVLLEA